VGFQQVKRVLVDLEVRLDSSGLRKVLVHVLMHGLLEHSVSLHVLLHQQGSKLIKTLVTQVFIQDFQSLDLLILTFVLGYILEKFADVSLSNLSSLDLFLFFGFNLGDHDLLFLFVFKFGELSSLELCAFGLKLSVLHLVLLFQKQG